MSVMTVIGAGATVEIAENMITVNAGIVNVAIAIANAGLIIIATRRPKRRKGPPRKPSREKKKIPPYLI